MLCSNCGKDIGQDEFCKYCGTKTNYKDKYRSQVDIFSSGYQEPNYDLLNTFATENGQKGIKIFVDGNIKDVINKSSIKYLLVNTLQDKDWIILPANKNADLESIKSYIGRHVRFNCVYEGKSGKLQLPVATSEDVYDYNTQISTKDDDLNKVNITEDSDKVAISKIAEVWDGVVTAFRNVGKNYIAAAKQLQGFENSDKETVREEPTKQEQDNEVDKLNKNLRTLKEMYDNGLLDFDEYNKKRDLILNNEKKEIKKPNNEKIRKCPYCGEILEAYSFECPSCRNKINDGFVSSAIAEFKNGLDRINEDYSQSMLIVMQKNDYFSRLDVKNTFNDKKVDYIKNFIIPVSVNDMLDFMILAKSNVEIKLYKKKAGIFDFCGYSDINDKLNAKKMSDAWFSMMQQIYDKAQISLQDSEAFNIIKQMYDEVKMQMIVF